MDYGFLFNFAMMTLHGREKMGNRPLQGGQNILNSHSESFKPSERIGTVMQDHAAILSTLSFPMTCNNEIKYCLCPI